jgi:DNA repair protein RadD
LAPLISKAGVTRADLSSLNLANGRSISDQVDAAISQPDLVVSACDEIVEYTRDRQAVLIFASSVAHGEQIVQTLANRHEIECGFVCGQTPPKKREELINRFRGNPSETLFGSAPLKYICNYNVLTTGFDAPNIDCIALLRGTESPGLLLQMVGRGARLSPGKQDCLILDFGGNILRHGPIDKIGPPDKHKRETGQAPAKECERCHTLVACGYSVCPNCGHPFPPPMRAEHDPKASTAGVLSGQVTDVEYEVQDTVYRVHYRRDAPDEAPPTMRVDYRIGLKDWQSEFVCLEHSGFARHKASRWWRERSPDPVPDSVEHAVAIAEAGGLATSLRITVRSIAGEKYDRIIKHVIGELPPPMEYRPAYDYDDDEVPF